MARKSSLFEETHPKPIKGLFPAVVERGCVRTSDSLLSTLQKVIMVHWDIFSMSTVTWPMETKNEDRYTFGSVALLSVSLSNWMIHNDCMASKCYVNFHFVLKSPNKLPQQWLPNDNTNSILSGMNSILILSGVIQRLTLQRVDFHWKPRQLTN